MPSPSAVVIHADWSKDEKKRIAAVARIEPTGGRIVRLAPFHEIFTDLEMLWHDVPTVIGFDFPIGVPAHYGRRLPFDNFRSFLFGLDDPAFETLSAPALHRSDISLARPFYPARPGGTRMDHLFEGLQAQRADLFRKCDLATSERPAACCLFWTLGANQVGRAAVSGWGLLRQLVGLGDLALWPYDGSFKALMSTRPLTVVETYPAESCRQIGLRIPRLWSKRRREDRQGFSPYLVDFCKRHQFDMNWEVARMVANGFDQGKLGEDYFDAFVGLLGMIDVVKGASQEGALHDAGIRDWEGWILGQKPA